MAEVLLVRHAQSYANVRDVAFGNVESPLTEKGIAQATALNALFKSQYDIIPEEYDPAVLASGFVRPRQTAECAGFRKIDSDPLINESNIPVELLSGRLIIEKHAHERWVPDELRERAQKFIKLVRAGRLEYQVYFSHGFFIASVLTELADEGQTDAEPFAQAWDEKRGFIPLLASVTPVDIR